MHAIQIDDDPIHIAFVGEILAILLQNVISTTESASSKWSKTLNLTLWSEKTTESSEEEKDPPILRAYKLLDW